ncbi:hypothetical protein [Billgrantia montanilacus]|uniref:Uncharacterized protein n=1 Tax=Billgrantia montanilacus TaxID=2282305 RepID=A0A368TS94_9GAMM|nr:hypothetical protein [Halomonas montanilacus]RCV87488.1 hypothetical protein DU505_17095 [Halomonas montanilacus]
MIGIDPTHSPAMRELLIKIAGSRMALKEARKTLGQVREAFAALTRQVRPLGDPVITEAGEALATALNDKRRVPFREFTDGLVRHARQNPPGAVERARLMGLVAQANIIMLKAQEARQYELRAMERLSTLTREAENLYALERKQGGGVH